MPGYGSYGGAENDILELALSKIEKHEDRVEALGCCLVAFAFKKNEMSLHLLQSTTTGFVRQMKIDEFRKLKELVISRVRVGPLQNRVYCANLATYYKWGLSNDDWKNLLTQKTLAVRKIISKHGFKYGKDYVKRSNLETYYLAETDESRKLILIGYLTKTKISKEPHLKFCRQLLLDAQTAKTRQLRQQAYDQLELATGQSWKASDIKWEHYLKEDLD